MAAPNASADHPIDLSVSADQADSVQRLDRWLDSPPDKYFDELLKAAAVATDAVAGQVWGLNETGRLIKVSAINPVTFQQLDQPDIVDDHKNLISKALFEGQLTSNSYRQRQGPTDVQRTLVLAPFHLEQESIGVVELILPQEIDDQRLPVVNELLAHISGYLTRRTQIQSATQSAESSKTERSKTLESAADLPNASKADQSISPDPATPTGISDGLDKASTTSQLSAEDVEYFILQLHQNVDLKYVSSAAVNEIRRLLNCDRVCMAVHRRTTTEIVAISGQDAIVNNSNTVRALREMSQQTIASGQVIRFDFDDNTIGQSDSSLVAYLGETGALRLRVIPLFAPEKIDFEAAAETVERIALAALCVEQFVEGRGLDTSDLQRLLPHIAQATHHAIEQEQIFLLPVRRAIGRWIDKAKLTKTKARIAVAGLALITAIMIFARVPYRVQATGKLMPVQQFRAYAPFDGEAREILVHTGQKVAANQPLLHLYDEALETRMLVLNNSLAEKRKLMAAYQAQLDEKAATLSQTEKIGLSAIIAQNSSEIDGLRLQLESAQRLSDQSIVRAKIAGTVATFRPQDLLAGRPVGRGELLVEVMNEQGPWKLELELPAARFGHLLQVSADDPSKPFVTFVQATHPEKTYTGAIQQISTRTSNDNEGAPVILIEASIDDGQDIGRTIGAEVIAKINCGKKSLGYACFGDMLDWIRCRVW